MREKRDISDQLKSKGVSQGAPGVDVSMDQLGQRTENRIQDRELAQRILNSGLGKALFNCSSAATGLSGRSFYLGYPAVDNISRAATAIIGVDINGTSRAVPGAGPAFHAGIGIKNFGLCVPQREKTMRTNRNAHSTTDTCLAFELENGHTVNVSEIFQCDDLLTYKWRGDPQNQGQYGTPYLKGQAPPHLFFNPGE